MGSYGNPEYNTYDPHTHGSTCHLGQHKRIEVTCLDCIEKLRAERDALNLQIEEQRKIVETAIAFVQVWESSPILLNSETGGNLSDAVNKLRVSKKPKGAYDPSCYKCVRFQTECGDHTGKEPCGVPRTKASL